MVTAFCLDCGYSVSLGPQSTEGQMVTCPNCDAQLEVISLHPLEIDWAFLAPVVDDEEWGRDWEEEWDEDWEKEEAAL